MTDLELTPVTREDIAELIWNTSRADESTISATGANIIADAILRVFNVTLPADESIERVSNIVKTEVIDDADLVTLDPRPWVDREDSIPICQSHPDPWTSWDPRPEYSQNPDDYHRRARNG